MPSPQPINRKGESSLSTHRQSFLIAEMEGFKEIDDLLKVGPNAPPLINDCKVALATVQGLQQVFTFNIYPNAAAADFRICVGG